MCTSTNYHGLAMSQLSNGAWGPLAQPTPYLIQADGSSDPTEVASLKQPKGCTYDQERHGMPWAGSKHVKRWGHGWHWMAMFATRNFEMTMIKQDIL